MNNNFWSHRNGETAPPTVAGFYWVIDGSHRGIVQVPSITEDFWAVNEIGEEDEFIVTPRAKWYGPIPPPTE